MRQVKRVPMSERSADSRCMDKRVSGDAADVTVWFDAVAAGC
jgi:hypothetical protein